MLARSGGLTFEQLCAGVQPATKFAVRSALNYGRKKKEIVFKDDLYALVTETRKRMNPAPAGEAGKRGPD